MERVTEPLRSVKGKRGNQGSKPCASTGSRDKKRGRKRGDNTSEVNDATTRGTPDKHKAVIARAEGRYGETPVCANVAIMQTPKRVEEQIGARPLITTGRRWGSVGSRAREAKSSQRA